MIIIIIIIIIIVVVVVVVVSYRISFQSKAGYQRT